MIGILLIMAVYNFFLYYSFRDISYIYYIIFLLFFVVTQTLFSRVISDIFTIFKDIEFTLSSYYIIRSGLITFLALFSINLLNLKTFVPKGFVVTRYLIIIVLAITLFIVLSNIVFLEDTLALLIFLLYVVLYINGLITLKKGYRPAKYFVIATSIVNLTIMFSAIGLFDWAPIHISVIIKYHIHDISFLSMIFLLSLSLADRVNIIKQEKEKAQKESIDNLKLVNKRLQAIDKQKDNFLANTSHELKTPLNGIIGIAESMLTGVTGPVNDKQKNHLIMMVSSGKRLFNLVNDLLDFSNLKNKEIILQEKTINLYHVAEIVIAYSQALIKNKDLALLNDIEKNISLVQADEDRVTQIFFNLIDNAIKFTASGEIIVRAKEMDDMVMVTVSDSGIGIPADKQNIIFDSFEQADGSISRIYGGTGLGLSISKYLVELHGGNISVESEHGNGADFSFTLPKSDERVAANTETLQVKEYELLEEVKESQVLFDEILIRPDVQFRILAVDDDPVNLMVIGDYLSYENCEVVKVNSGNDALRRINEEKFHLVLLDLMMPQMSGYEVCAEIRKYYLPNEMPIIILTAKNQISDLIEGFKLGTNDYVPKPFTRSELVSRVELHLKLSMAYSELSDINNNLETIIATRTSELMDSESRYRQLIELLPDIVVLYDKNIITYINESGLKVLGTRDSKDVTGRSIFDFIVPEYQSGLKKELEKIKETGEVLALSEGKIIRLDKSLIDVDYSTRLFDRKKVTYVTVLRDVTDRKLAERFHGDLEWVVHHEIKNRLTNIITFCQMMSRDKGLDDKQLDKMNKIIESSYNISNILENSINIFKMDRGSYKIKRENFDLIKALQKVQFNLNSLADSKSLKLQFLLDGKDLNWNASRTISGEEEYILLLFNNLIKNTIVLSDEGMTVKIQIKEKSGFYIITMQFSGTLDDVIKKGFFEKRDQSSYRVEERKNIHVIELYSAELITKSHGGEISFQS
ncbi:MAG: ATP-binding protein, partial [Spirochaetota bacterium]|nr:ATP-binding protein [Spirochaetota bacterium]